jgi:uncharacterized membrane protein
MARKPKNQPPLQALPPLPLRMLRLHAKLMIAAVAGVVVGFAAPGSWRIPTRILVGWDLAAVIYLATTQWTFVRCSIDVIRKRASEQDEGAFAILLLTVASTIASQVAIVFELGGLKEAGTPEIVHRALFGILTIVLSWAFVHTIFAIHYAHEYYGERSDKKLGGLKFPDDADPNYWDFLYFSLVIAMTSQVSDVAITSKTIRQVATLHAVLSFFFNLTILALTVNIVSNLI